MGRGPFMFMSSLDIHVRFNACLLCDLVLCGTLDMNLNLISGLGRANKFLF